MKNIIFTTDAPAPIGPYSQAVEKNGTLYISGQIAINPVNNQLVIQDITAETHQVMQNLSAVLKAAGYKIEHIVKCGIFLNDMNNFDEMNAVYNSYFTDNYPARECVAVKTLPKNVNVEISAIAVK